MGNEKRRLIRLAPGVGLEKISVGDILSVKDERELVIYIDQGKIVTLKRSKDSNSIIELVYKKRDYDENKGRFRLEGAAITNYNRKFDSSKYSTLNAQLKEANM